MNSWNIFYLGIPRITGTMDIFDSYPAVNFAFKTGKTDEYIIFEIELNNTF